MGHISFVTIMYALNFDKIHIKERIEKRNVYKLEFEVKLSTRFSCSKETVKTIKIR